MLILDSHVLLFTAQALVWSRIRKNLAQARPYFGPWPHSKTKKESATAAVSSVPCP